MELTMGWNRVEGNGLAKDLVRKDVDDWLKMQP
jgi:hypothetical protein